MGGSGSAGMGSMVCGGGACSVVIGRGTGLEVGSLLSLHEASSMIVEMRMMSGFGCMAVCLNAEPMTCLVCGTPRKRAPDHGSFRGPAKGVQENAWPTPLLGRGSCCSCTSRTEVQVGGFSEGSDDARASVECRPIELGQAEVCGSLVDAGTGPDARCGPAVGVFSHDSRRESSRSRAQKG